MSDLKQILDELEEVNDSYVDLLWNNLESELDDVRSLTVEQWLRRLHTEYFHEPEMTPKADG
ncbi:MAG: hypothetical protein J7J46_07005 [Candidatus Desulfofervidus sp.]|nr:hypothetical protein [Candidatus Desulfofervidus sp.]